MVDYIYYMTWYSLMADYEVDSECSDILTNTLYNTILDETVYAKIGWYIIEVYIYDQVALVNIYNWIN